MKRIIFLLAQYLVPHHLLSRLTGALAACELKAIKTPLIQLFLRWYKIDLAEAQYSKAADFSSFNAFFTRALKPGARPIFGDEDQWVSPVDGNISQVGDIDCGALLQAKGKTFQLTDLLAGDASLASRFHQGGFLTLYLSPRDYHRVHMPLTGRLVKTTFVPGRLFSVNGITTAHVDRLFARNERLICEFESPQGHFVLVLVGAMVVASIETRWAGVISPNRGRSLLCFEPEHPLQFSKGEEIARFRLGSTVILLTEGRIPWHQDVQADTAIKLGELLSRR